MIEKVLPDLAARVGPGHVIALVLIALIWAAGDRLAAELHGVQTAMAALAGEIRRGTDHQDQRAQALEQAQARWSGDLARALERVAAMTAAACLAAADGDEGRRRICEQALLE